MRLHALYALSATTPTSNFILKWFVLFGIVMYGLLAVSLLMERPPRKLDALRKVMWALWLVLIYIVYTRADGQRYFLLFIPLVLGQIAIDLWQWRSSRTPKAL